MKVTAKKVIFWLSEVIGFIGYYVIVHPAMLNTETDAALIADAIISFIAIPAIVITQVVDLVKKMQKEND